MTDDDLGNETLVVLGDGKKITAERFWTTPDGWVCVTNPSRDGPEKVVRYPPHRVHRVEEVLRE